MIVSQRVKLPLVTWTFSIRVFVRISPVTLLPMWLPAKCLGKHQKISHLLGSCHPWGRSEWSSWLLQYGTSAWSSLLVAVAIWRIDDGRSACSLSPSIALPFK